MVSTGTNYELVVRAAGERRVERRFEMEAARLDLGLIETGPVATVRVRSHAPVRLVFIGVGDTPNPRFNDDHLEFTVGHARFPNGASSNTLNLAGSETQSTAVVLAPGRYRVLATRGPEFDVTETSLTLDAGDDLELEFALPERAFETAGWLSADLHVHSSRSFDSTVPSSDQVRAFAAIGGDVIVSTEHDFVVDYSPVIERLGLGDRMRSIVGTEATSTASTQAAPYTLGHANVFPWSVAHGAYRQGALASEGRRVREIIAELRESPHDPLIQANHLRTPYPGDGSIDEASYFTHLGVAGESYRPDRPLDAAPNHVLIERDPVSGLRDLDFDAIELMSGPSRLAYRRTRADWLSLILQGEFRTGTANSDSHDPRNPVGLPRTYVRAAGGRVASFDEAEFITALREGHAIGTTGPWLEVDLDGAGPGERLSAREAILRVRVDAAPWVPVSELRVRVNAVLVYKAETWPGKIHELPLRFERDAFVTVEVEGAVTDPYSEISPGAVPLAFANPIFVDADGDGAWRPPGLSAELPDVLIDPANTP